MFQISSEEKKKNKIYIFGSGGIRTHASEETGALNQRLRPLGHATLMILRPVKQMFYVDFESNVN